MQRDPNLNTHYKDYLIILLFLVNFLTLFVRMPSALERLVRFLGLCMALVELENERAGLFANRRNIPPLAAFDSSDTCSAELKSHRFGSTQPSFFQDTSLVDYGCFLKNHKIHKMIYPDIHFDDLTKLTTHIQELAKRYPEHTEELMSFLDCRNVHIQPYVKDYVWGISNFMDKYFIIRKKQEEHSPLLIVSDDGSEVRYIASPKSQSRGDVEEYKKWLKIVDLPSPIRNIILKNEKLARNFYGKVENAQFIGLNTYQVKIKQKNGLLEIMTFKNTFSGWRHVTTSEPNSWDEIVARNFGVSLPFRRR